MSSGSLDVVSPGLPTLDGCDLFSKSTALVVDQGLQPTLEWIFRDANGSPIDLSSYFAASESTSESEAAPYRVELRVDKALKRTKKPPTIATGDVHEAEGGVVRVDATEAMTRKAGIYQAHWAVIDQETERPVVVRRSILSVERSLFGQDYGINGPPTLQEIRLEIRDTEGGVNRLLANVEFDDMEILQSVVSPVEEWNQSTPMLNSHQYDTSTFPWRRPWMLAIQGYLLRYATHWYRRNKLGYQAGGVSIDDMNKDKEYAQASELFLGEWKAWMLRKKSEINAYGVFGTVGSEYSGLW